MKNKTKNHFRAEVSEKREEAFCSNPECGERFHISELVNLNEEYIAKNETYGYTKLWYDSLVCVPCQRGIHTLIEVETIIKKAANEH